MADFQLAIPIVLANEGGYSCDSQDPGGETNFGISKRSYPTLDIKNLTIEEATAIYLRDFWIFGGIKSQAVGTKVFDSYVNMKHRAILLAQECLGFAPALVDGVYGPRTEAAINSMSEIYFLTSYRNVLSTYYKNLVNEHPSLRKFLNGWERRAAQ